MTPTGTASSVSCVLIFNSLGRDFGAFVTHETSNYIYFYIGQRGYLLWSSPK